MSLASRIETVIFVAVVWLIATAASAGELTRADALEILKKDALTAAPVKQGLVLATRCTIGGRIAVPDDLAALEKRGLIKVTQSPLDPKAVAIMWSDGVNAMLGSIPDACIFTIRNAFGGMAGMVAAGQRDFNVMDVAITDAGRAIGLGTGYTEIPILRDDPDEITAIVSVDRITRRVEYKVRYAFTEAGTKTGLADVYARRTPPPTRIRFFRSVGENWGLVP